MSKFSVNIILTFSKLMAFLILMAGCIFAFITKDSTVILATFSTVMIILGVKQYQDRFKEPINKIE